MVYKANDVDPLTHQQSFRVGYCYGFLISDLSLMRIYSSGDRLPS